MTTTLLAVLFEARFREPIADGSVTLTFRRWKRSQAVAGHRYRTAAGMIEVEAVDIVDESSITDRDAKRAGYPSRDALVADLRGTKDLAVYRVQFHSRAPDLATSFGRETAPFKIDVRKLKNLGLTISLTVGYRISPRGEAYLRQTRRAKGRPKGTT